MPKDKDWDHVHQKPEGTDNPFKSGWWACVISSVCHPSFSRPESNSEEAATYRMGEGY